MSKIKLSEEQEKALHFLFDFAVNSKEHVATLRGPGGTGKTSIIEFLCDKLDEHNIGVDLIAPTHTSKIILKEKTRRPVDTIHSYLKLSPDLLLEDLDLKDLKFVNKGTIFTSKVIICDEGSMINDYLFEFLEKVCKTQKRKIIYILDEAQLAPVKEDLSKTVLCENTFILTKVFRQNEENGANKYINKLRERDIETFKQSLGTKGSLFVENNEKVFLRKYAENIKPYIDNVKFCKDQLMTYTNKKLESYNRSLHKYFFKNAEYCKGEPLLFYSTIEKDDILNSEKYIIVDSKSIILNIPFIGEFPGYRLLIQNIRNETKEIKVLSNTVDDSVIDYIGATIENLRKKALKTKNWKEYYILINSFSYNKPIMFDGRCVKTKTLDYGYAITIHKSQSQTLGNVYVNIKDVNICSNLETRRQLKYVAFSRTSNNIIIYQ